MRATDAQVEAALATHGPDVLRYLQRRAGDESADLLGATMLVAWRRRKQLPSDPESARRWLFGIARMTLKGHGRDEVRRMRLTARVREQLAPPAEVDHPEALDVRQAISWLPEAQAELVRLVHWEGFSLADAAQVMGLNASTARGRYQKAREELARLLAVTVKPG